MRRELQNQIRFSAVATYFGHDRGTLPAALCNVVAFTVCGAKTGQFAFYALAIAQLVIHAFRERISRGFAVEAQEKPTPKLLRRWEVRAVLIGGSIALSLGIGCLVAFIATEDRVVQMIAFMTALGNMLGIIARSFAVTTLVKAQTVTVCVPTAIGLAASGDPWLAGVSWIALPFYLIVVMLTAKMRDDLMGVVEDRAIARETADRFQATLTSVPEALVHIDHEGRVAVMNRAARRLFGIEAAGAPCHRPFEEIAGQSGTFGPAELSRLAFAARPGRGLAGATEKLWSVENRCLLVGAVSSEVGKLLILTDVTEKELAERRLADMARVDHLTGLHSRAWFIERAEAALKDANGLRAPLAVLDLDNFKAVNDTLGHKAGDAVLCELADLIRSVMPLGTLATRQGGDEFALFMQGEDDDLRIFDDAIVELLERFADRGRNGLVPYSASAGIAGEPGGLDHLFACADLALYSAKRAGKDMRIGHGTRTAYHREFDEELRGRHVLRLETKAALGRTLEAGDGFHLAYQPIIDPTTSRITCAEALCRWTDSNLGHVPPGMFVPLAEELGAMRRLTDFVLRKATCECSRWPNDVRVSVNLSSVDLQGSDLPRRVTEALERANLEPHRLQL